MRILNAMILCLSSAALLTAPAWAQAQAITQGLAQEADHSEVIEQRIRPVMNLRVSRPQSRMIGIRSKTMSRSATMGPRDTGGGTGVACFGSVDIAEEVRSVKGSLPGQLVSEIKSLYTTEIWENAQTMGFIEPLPDENPRLYLHRVLSLYFAQTIPSFLQRLEKALDIVDLQKASQAASGIRRYSDTGTVFQNGDLARNDAEPGPFINGKPALKCVLVQIALRHVSTRDDQSLRVTVTLDPCLFRLLGSVHGQQTPRDRVLNQAALQLHEALYFLGYGLGQSDSKEVRRLTATILSATVYNQIYQISLQHSDANSYAAGFLVDLIYQMGFGEFAVIGKGHLSPLKNEINLAFQSYEKKIQTLQTHPEEQDLTIGNLSGAESFIRMGITALEFGRIADFYALMDPDSSLSAARDVCQFSRQFASRMNPPETQATKYCFARGL